MEAVSLLTLVTPTQPISCQGCVLAFGSSFTIFPARFPGLLFFGPGTLTSSGAVPCVWASECCPPLFHSLPAPSSLHFCRGSLSPLLSCPSPPRLTLFLQPPSLAHSAQESLVHLPKPPQSGQPDWSRGRCRKA